MLFRSELVVGTNVRVESPRYFGCIGNNPTASSSRPALTNSAWYCPQGAGGDVNTILTPRGSQFEGDWLTQIDLSVRYNLDLVGTTATFSLDVFNALNQKAELDFDETGDLGGFVPDPNFGNVTSYQSPRSVRLGIAFRY